MVSPFLQQLLKYEFEDDLREDYSSNVVSDYGCKPKFRNTFNTMTADFHEKYVNTEVVQLLGNFIWNFQEIFLCKLRIISHAPGAALRTRG